MSVRIFVLLAHPDRDSFNGGIADSYCAAATAAGHEVRRQDLGSMRFDPVLWKGYKVIQELESDLRQAQQNIVWCERWVIVYPIWWGSVPALLKGFFDRTLYSEFAYRYHKKDPFWDRLLKGRSAHIITTSDAPTLWIWWQYRNSDINAVRRATLEFCGFRPVRVTRIARVKYLSAAERAAAIRKVVASV